MDYTPHVKDGDKSLKGNSILVKYSNASTLALFKEHYLYY